MTKLNKKIFLIVFSIPGIIIIYFLSYLIELILIPDECFFHQHETNWFIELLYDFPSWNGCHPYPSNFHFLLIIVFGIYLSYQFCKRVLKL